MCVEKVLLIMDAPAFNGFEILEVMPQGAMGTVYKARQISLDRVVAIKMLPPGLAADSADIDQFLAEARITANLKHQNIIQVYDFGKTEEDIYFFVMEFVSGYSVGEWIRRKHFLSEENALLVAESVAEALEYAWNKDGVIHCDIKPDNIMIDGDGTVKVADLGLAKSMSSVVDCQKTAAGIVCGTPNFISPEQSSGDMELDQRADIYSLGAMLYHCMTGKMPFEGEPLIKVMDLQISDQIPDPQDVNPAISTEAAWLIERMMAKNREHRHPDWKAVLADIARVANHKMPTILPAQGQSTIRRRLDRGKHPRVKVPVVRHPKTEQMRSYTDNIAFENMERKFERKQKQHVLPKLESWFAAAIGIAIVALAGLVLRSVLGGSKARPSSSAQPAANRSQQDPAAIAKAEQDVAQYQEEARMRNAGTFYQEALLWVEKNPGQHDDAIAVFKKAAHDARGTEYAAMALGEIEMLQDSRNRAVSAVLRSLEAEADALGEEGRHEEAAALLEHYDGEMANETSDARLAQAREWRKKQHLIEQDEKNAGTQLQGLIQETSAALVNGDLQSALLGVRGSLLKMKTGAAKTELGKLEELLSGTAKAEQRILSSFVPLKGQEVSILLTTGSEKLTIRSVHEDRIEAEKIVVLGAGHASQPRTIRMEDLAPDEKLLRLGEDDRPETALMKGLILVQCANLDSAEPLFASVGPILANPLVAEIERRRQQQIEESARQTLSWFLRTMRVDIPETIPSADHVVAVIRQKRFSEEDAKIVTRGVDAYRKKFGETEFIAQYQSVLTALETAAARETGRVTQRARLNVEQETPTPTEYARADDESIRGQLLQKNPGINHEHIRFGSDSSGRITAVAIYSPALRDIQPLAALSDLRSATLSGQHPWETGRALSALSDISPLQGKQLEELNLAGTEVRDISALLGMPLRKLNLSRTKFQDLQWLSGMQLTELDISSTPIRNLRALQGMPLEQLNIAGTGVDNILPLRDMKLSVFNAKGTKIRQITLLRGMPLRSLNLSDTGVGEVSSLAGMPLTRLEIARTQVRDLTPLTGMRLEQLDIEGTSMRNLSILQGMPLVYLNAANTRTTDLSPLAGMPLRSLYLGSNDIRNLAGLETLSSLRELNLDSTKIDNLNSLKGMMLENLSIKNTAVKDLSPLSSMPIKRLDLTGTPIRDLTPIQYLPIEHIYLDNSLLRQQDSSGRSTMFVLRRIRSLKTINGMRPFDY